MKIVGTLLLLHFERNAEDFAVEFVTFGRLTDNWTKTYDEQNFDVARNLHGYLLFLICGGCDS